MCVAPNTAAAQSPRSLWQRLRGEVPDAAAVVTPPWARVVLGLILLSAFVLRVYRLSQVPAGLFCDEAANGYNAYALLHTGRDEHGKLLPLFIWSFYAFKYPLDIYASIPWVGLFGLSEFATRFQAVLYGIGSILVAFLIARRLFGHVAGLAAAVALTVMPWHFHFSRVAFAMTSFAFWFGLAVYYLLRAVSPGARRRDWLLSAGFFAACFYAYAVSQLLVPIFLLFALALAGRAVWQHRRWALQAAAAGVLAALPFVVFYLRHFERASVYVKQTSILAYDMPAAEKVRIIRENYPVYFGRSFLFRNGDPILRHQVRGFGELPPALLPWMIAGALVLVIRRGSANKILLLWLFLYPLGAVVTRETPSATRSFIGTMIFAILAGAGFQGAVALLGLLPIRALRAALAGVLTLLAALPLVRQSGRYLHHYFTEYPRYGAVGIEGFQYGYRRLFEVMEERRLEVDDLFYSSTSVNSPYILNLFYVRRRPLALSEWGDAETEYRAVRPPDLDRWYNPERKILMAALSVDMALFESWDERIDINGPGGDPAFIVLRNPRPKKFIEQWELLGPFENPDNSRRDAVLVDPQTMQPRETPVGGHERWEPYDAVHGLVDLNRDMAPRLPRWGNNPEFAIAYLRAALEAGEAHEARIELTGSRDEMAIWINGAPVVARTELDELKLTHLPVRLQRGRNVLLIRTVETVGDWWFFARLVGPDNKADPDARVVTRAEAVPR